MILSAKQLQTQLSPQQKIEFDRLRHFNHIKPKNYHGQIVSNNQVAK